MQMLIEQMSCLAQEVDGLKTQMQHHRNEQSLLSDHFALETTLPVQSAPAVPRKRLMVPPSRMAGLVVHVVAWYAALKGSFADAEALYDGLLHTITTPRVLARAHAPCRWTYATNSVILNCQQTLAAYQRHRESQDAMVTVAQHLMYLRQQERKKYWISFLDKVCRIRSLREVWHHVNSIRGKSR
ncbi:hypothetical protein E2C01_057872 [Portunus trituberculatus]|uniref:Uncharacterized protein n=1 Tax=Portunus trituberculatus TaxID=210409 RepID=A0A5B7H1J1_PORTR|nr:hypothetical protein [Portunus trituberculatus]